ncbi:hypothetical protein [Obesumbacterium proteus]|uniref:hypothetical protein n=1 Tax=Obesumbacterium proteus TaxID=82983 RepID=UPI00242E99FC|nr:hypothetical protein [Obesumbacterium proteus]
MDGNDFSEAIDNLKRRASSARKTRSIIATVLFILSLIIFGIIYINTTSGLAKGMSDVYKKLALNNNDKFNNGIENIYSNIINDSNSLAEDASSTSKIKSEKSKDSKLLQASQDNFERMIKNLEVKTKIMDSYAEWKGVRYKLGQGRDNQSIINSVTTSVATIAFSICSILLLLFLVQISVMFMRYYAQLAELYDSQALALIVSEGNTDKAISFAKEFSPKVISIGKSPDSVYEKAFDVIGNVINKKES